MKFSPLLEDLIRDLQVMPGIGPKSAQRIAFNLLDLHRSDALQLSDTLKKAMTIGYCHHCHCYCENDVCEICNDPKRIAVGMICIVESPADVLAIEQTEEFSGTYFVLHGHLSPLDGIGPKELHLEDLEKTLSTGNFKEIILATNSTVEGDATAHYIGHIAERYGVQASRIARGIPVGSDLDSIDGSTLTRSLSGRRPL
jgi:recombination protein RecR